MSHVVLYTVTGNEVIFQTCHTLIDQLNEFKQNTTLGDGFKQEINAKIQQIVNEQDKLKKIKATKNEFLRAQLRLDTLAKEIANINWINVVSKSLKETELVNKKTIVDCLSKYGFMAQVAINQLQEQNKELNAVNIENKIDEIRQQEISNNELKKFYEQAYKFVDDLKLNDQEINYLLKQKVQEFKTAQTLSDYYAYCMNKKTELINMNILIKKIMGSLNGSEQYVLAQKSITKIDEEGKLITYLIMRNNKNNIFMMQIDSNLHIEYKLGNYVGHACEKTSEQLMKFLQQSHYEIEGIKITRNISNEKPLYKSVFIQDKEKNK